MSGGARTSAAPRGAQALWGLAPLLGVLACLYATTLSDELGFLGGDDARYLLLADALKDGRGYVEVERAAAPPHTLYPPLFPLLLAPLRALDPGGYRLPHLLVVGSALVAVATLFLLLRRSFGGGRALLGAGLLGLAPVLARSLLPILTELPFVALTLGALVLHERHRASGQAVSVALVLAAALAAAAFLARTAGIALIAALVAAGVLRLPGRLRARLLGLLVTLAIVVPPVAGWYLWTSRHRAHRLGYIEQLLARDPYQPELGRIDRAGLLARARQRGASYLAEVPALFVEGVAAEKPLRRLAGWLVGLLLLLGAARALARPRLWHLYLLTYSAMILVWPWHGERYLVPAVPLLVGLLLGGSVVLERLLAWVMPRRLAMAAATVPVAALVVACVPGWLRFHRVAGENLAYHGPRGFVTSIDFSAFYEAHRWMARGAATARAAARAWGEYIAMGRWLADRDPHAVVGCRKPRLTGLTAGLRTEGLPAPAPPADYLARLRRRGVGYVISLGGSFAPDAAQRALDRARARYPACLRRRCILGSVELLGVEMGAAGGGRGSPRGCRPHRAPHPAPGATLVPADDRQRPGGAVPRRSRGSSARRARLTSSRRPSCPPSSARRESGGPSSGGSS